LPHIIGIGAVFGIFYKKKQSSGLSNAASSQSTHSVVNASPASSRSVVVTSPIVTKPVTPKVKMQPTSDQVADWLKTGTIPDNIDCSHLNLAHLVHDLGLYHSDKSQFQKLIPESMVLKLMDSGLRTDDHVGAIGSVGAFHCAAHYNWTQVTQRLLTQGKGDLSELTRPGIFPWRAQEAGRKPNPMQIAASQNNLEFLKMIYFQVEEGTVSEQNWFRAISQLPISPAWLSARDAAEILRTPASDLSTNMEIKTLLSPYAIDSQISKIDMNTLKADIEMAMNDPHPPKGAHAKVYASLHNHPEFALRLIDNEFDHKQITLMTNLLKNPDQWELVPVSYTNISALRDPSLGLPLAVLRKKGETGRVELNEALKMPALLRKLPGERPTEGYFKDWTAAAEAGSSDRAVKQEQFKTSYIATLKKIAALDQKHYDKIIRTFHEQSKHLHFDLSHPNNVLIGEGFGVCDVDLHGGKNSFESNCSSFYSNLIGVNGYQPVPNKSGHNPEEHLGGLTPEMQRLQADIWNKITQAQKKLTGSNINH